MSKNAIINANEIGFKLKEIFDGVGVNITEEEIKDDVELEIDSLQFVTVICDIESKFNIEVPDEFLMLDNLNLFSAFLNMIFELLKYNTRQIEG